MEIEHLKEYIAFTDSLNFSKAAKDAFISEPTLRSHMKALEDELGTSLTSKRSNQLELSPAGRLFLKHARKITQEHEEAIRACQELSDNAISLLIGTFNCSTLEEILTSARDIIRQHNPEAEIDLRFVNTTSANTAAIVDQKVDFTLLPRVRSFDSQHARPQPSLPPGVEGIYFETVPLKFWTSRNNSFFTKRVISAQDLDSKTLLLGNADNMVTAATKLLEYFKNQGVTVSIDHQPYSSYSDYLFSTINDGFGIVLEAFHPNLSTRKDLRIFSIEEFSIKTDMYLIYNESRLSAFEARYLKQIAIQAEQRLQSSRCQA